MISRVWAGLILLSCAGVVFNLLNDNGALASAWVEALFSMSELSVDIAFGLIGALCFWMGMFQIAQDSGIVTWLGRRLEPLLCRLMPEVPKGHPALGAMTMNIAANVLGLDNAATPMGLKAMTALQELNPIKNTLSDAQLLFVVLNTTSVTLLPVTILMYRVELGAQEPADVLLPIILATSCSTLVGVGLAAWYQKLSLWSGSFILGIILYLVGLVGLSIFVQSQGSKFLSQLGNVVLIGTVGWILSAGLWQKVAVYEAFIAGAKRGFAVAIKIIPYLVAMLVAIGVLRASGVFEVILSAITWLLVVVNGPTEIVGALPTAFMKPFSGSGARALMLETMQHYGVDSLQGRIAAIMQGSTETTFYVLSVYLGVVGISRSRYLISTCLLADVAGCIAAIIFGILFFG